MSPTTLPADWEHVHLPGLQDLMMPGLSGFDVLQALRDKFQFGELPVVMVSVDSLVICGRGWTWGCVRDCVCVLLPTQAKNQSSSVVKGSSSALIEAERLRRKDNFIGFCVFNPVLRQRRKPTIWMLHRCQGYDLGCADWIHKPFCRQELIARVKANHCRTDCLQSSAFCSRRTAFRP